MSIMQLIKASQNSNQDTLNTLIYRFEPLIRKYASKFYHDYEDVHSELVLVLIRTVLKDMNVDSYSLKSESGAIKYIQKSIYHAYIAFSKKKMQTNRELPFSYFGTEESSMHFDNKLFEFDDYFETEIKEILLVLPAKEALIIILIFFHGLHGKEVAEKLGIAPSTVTYLKNSAIEKLKNHYASPA